MRLVWLTGVAAALLFAGIAVYLAPLQPGVLALQLAFSPKSFALVVHAWPPEHLQRFRLHLPLDLVLLGCYGTFGYLVATRTALFNGYAHWARRAAALVLPLAATFDAAENLLHWWLTEIPRFGVAPVYFISAACAAMKWLLLLGFVLAALNAFARGGPETA
ncbi:MAG: hypothetical protein Q8M11_16745 [Sulfuritalea sp.]|nr:hypothetical protein [Sulfuritalea sp.]MDP1984672.1 hypothetical protein [Sulfuritalea sp.]